MLIVSVTIDVPYHLQYVEKHCIGKNNATNDGEQMASLKNAITKLKDNNIMSTKLDREFFTFLVVNLIPREKLFEIFFHRNQISNMKPQFTKCQSVFKHRLHG
jgi:hypothetical protein